MDFMSHSLEIKYIENNIWNVVPNSSYDHKSFDL